MSEARLSPVVLSIRRGEVNQWHRQEASVLVGAVEIKRLWLPVEWSDDEMAAHLMFGVTPKGSES